MDEPDVADTPTEAAPGAGPGAPRIGTGQFVVRRPRSPMRSSKTTTGSRRSAISSQQAIARRHRRNAISAGNNTGLTGTNIRGLHTTPPHHLSGRNHALQQQSHPLPPVHSALDGRRHHYTSAIGRRRIAQAQQYLSMPATLPAHLFLIHLFHRDRLRADVAARRNVWVAAAVATLDFHGIECDADDETHRRMLWCWNNMSLPLFGPWPTVDRDGQLVPPRVSKPKFTLGPARDPGPFSGVRCVREKRGKSPLSQVAFPQVSKVGDIDREARRYCSIRYGF
ncbi:hypothetical protein B0H67DRAFT_548457 [Lasiosphaeris hirsuta]|uniref:Uncharacterized protein n=1 Tax=Lasiosphaeris hirsuta TaxID=260670 RepID=A0AA40ECN7_9PEZI|nr:hypothetical protein B0H67DRAFT_548457 [Lasiosphaeris hirsuta]